MRLNNYLARVIVYQIDQTAGENLSSPFHVLRPKEREGFVGLFIEILKNSGDTQEKFEVSIKRSENIFITMGVEHFFLKVKPLSERERLDIYAHCFPFFAARIHLPEQTRSKLAITKPRAIKMTGFPARSVKSDLAKFRRLWPISRNLVKTCLAQESALEFSEKSFKEVVVPWEQTGFYEVTEKDSSEKTIKMLITYLSGKVFTSAGLSALDHGGGGLMKYITDVRKDMAMKFEWVMTSAKYPFDPKTMTTVTTDSARR